VAIAEPHITIDAPTQEATGLLPRVPDRERRRASATLPQLPSGRYLGIEDAGEIVFISLVDAMHIGRSPAADIVLDDASVSRRHALIALRGDATVLLDDRSLNGIVVNGRRVTEATLSHGDVIVLGRITLHFFAIP